MNLVCYWRVCYVIKLNLNLFKKKEYKVDVVCVLKIKGELMELLFEVWIKENWVMMSNLRFWFDKWVIVLVDEVCFWCIFLLFYKE